MRERDIERKLVNAIKAAGGICPKWVAPGFDGVPDRIVLMPGYKWYNKNVQKIQNKNVQLIYCSPGGEQYDFTKQHYYKLRN